MSRCGIGQKNRVARVRQSAPGVLEHDDGGDADGTEIVGEEHEVRRYEVQEEVGHGSQLEEAKMPQAFRDRRHNERVRHDGVGTLHSHHNSDLRGAEAESIHKSEGQGYGGLVSWRWRAQERWQQRVVSHSVAGATSAQNVQDPSASKGRERGGKLTRRVSRTR